MDPFAKIFELAEKANNLEKRNEILKTKIYSILRNISNFSTYDEIKEYIDQFINDNKIKL